MPVIKVGFVTIVRGTFDTAYGQSIRERVIDLLTRDSQVSGTASANTTLEVLPFPEQVSSAEEGAAAATRLKEQGAQALIVLQVTFADGSIITEMARAAQLGIVVWGIPEPAGEVGRRLSQNSLCGVNLAAHSLRRIGEPYSCVYGPVDADTAQKVARRARALAARQSLHGKRLLVVGDPPTGFYPSEYDVQELRAVFGIEVHQVSLTDVFARAEAIEKRAVDEEVRRLGSSLSGLSTVPATQVERSVRAYLALRSYVDELQIAGVATECWPRFMTEYGGAACWPLSRLSDDGICAACETDVLGTVTMLLQSSLVGRASFFADLVQVDAKENTGVFWHCGAAPASLAGREGARAAVQPNRKVGLALNFGLGAGRVTVAKISRSPEGLSMFLTTGTGRDEPMQFLGNTLVVELDANVDTLLDTVFTRGLDHHYCVGYGDVAEEMRLCAEAFGLDVIESR